MRQGAKRLSRPNSRSERAEEAAEEPGQNQVQAQHPQEDDPEQPGRGVKARLVAEQAQAVIGQGGQGQVDAAVDQGQGSKIPVCTEPMRARASRKATSR